MTLETLFKQVFAQISRNKMMTAASLISITAILVVLGLFFLVIVNINAMANDVQQSFDQVQVNLFDAVDTEESTELMREIERLRGVESTKYQTRETAMENWKEKWAENADLLDKLTTNPLPNSIIITLSDVEYAKSIVEAVGEMSGIESINYSQDTVDKLMQVTRIIQLVSFVIITALVAVSITVVSNTIKLTVLAREREITIMRYIGATNGFIRGPFFMEGVLIGVISAAISSVAIGVIYYFAIDRFGVDLAMLMPTGFVPLRFMIENLSIIFLALGVSIGACGSIISMRRFLEK